MGYALQNPAANDVQPGEGALQRLSVFLGATIQSGANRFAARIRCLSSHGAYLEAAVVPPIGSHVWITRGAVSVAAQVTWTGKASFELRFREAIDELELLVKPGGRRRKEPSLKAMFPTGRA